MKRSFERAMQRITDRVEAQSGSSGEEKLYLSQVIEAVDSLEAEGHPIDFLLANQDLIAQRLFKRQLNPGLLAASHAVGPMKFRDAAARAHEQTNSDTSTL